MTEYTPTSHGYPCAAMMRYRPEMVDSKRIEIYPTEQWGLLGDYESGPFMPYSGPENANMVSAREALRRLNGFTVPTFQGETT